MRSIQDTSWKAISTAFVIGVLSSVAGCALPTQPGFPITSSQARREYKAMRQDPKPLVRPVVVLGGYRAPYHVQVRVISGLMARMTTGVRADVLGISFFYNNSIESAADRAIAKIEAQWPSDDPGWTVEVDAVGISMGGLIARQAWASGQRADGSARKRLRLGRLFTIATPHRGACLAQTVAPDKMARQMLAGSALLTALDIADEDRDYEMICYARTRDAIVGARQTAPAGEAPYWVHGPLLLSHMTVARDWRIRVDIARRLRGETPFALESSAPPSN